MSSSRRNAATSDHKDFLRKIPPISIRSRGNVDGNEEEENLDLGKNESERGKSLIVEPSSSMLGLNQLRTQSVPLPLDFGNLGASNNEGKDGCNSPAKSSSTSQRSAVDSIEQGQNLISSICLCKRACAYTWWTVHSVISMNVHGNIF